MNLDQLMGRYFQLQQELSIAYQQEPWQGQRIDRLADELSTAEREIASRSAPAMPAAGPHPVDPS
jgi:hypothetical protein